MKRSGPPKRDPAKVREMEQRARAQSAQNARLRASGGLRRTNAAPKGGAASTAPRRSERRKRAPKRWREGREGVCAVPGCGRRSGLHPHHVIYAQHVEVAGGDVWDPRNRLMLCEVHHLGQHDRTNLLPTSLLRDETLEFGIEVLGADGLVVYLRRYYRATDADLAARGLAA